MCWCQPEMKTPFCGDGPCQWQEVAAFQKIVRELSPAVANNTTLMKEVTRLWVQDREGWEHSRQLMKSAEVMGKNAAVSLNNRISDFLRWAPWRRT